MNASSLSKKRNRKSWALTVVMALICLAFLMPILIVVLYVLPSLLRFDPLGIYLGWTAGGIYNLLLTGL